MTLSKNLANALGAERIRLVHFNVGWVLTENEYQYKLADGFPENWPDQLGPIEIPSGRMTRPEEIASVVSFLDQRSHATFFGYRDGIGAVSL